MTSKARNRPENGLETTVPNTPPTYEAKLAAAEQADLPRILATQNALENAREAIHTTRQDHDDAEEHLEIVETSFLSGDGEFSDQDHAVATSAVRRTALRTTGAEHQLKAAERNVLSEDVEAATAVADALRPAMPGTTILPTFIKSLPTPAATDLPVLVIVQPDTAEVDRQGIVRGKVTLRYYREQNHKPLDGDVIDKALRAAGANVHCRTVSTDRLDQLDSMEIVVNQIPPTVPILKHIDTLRAQTIGSKLVHALVAPTTGRHDVIRQDERVSYTSKIKATSNECRTEEATEGNRRLVTVDSSLIWQQTGSLDYSTNDLVARCVDDLVGQFVPGVGRIVSSELVDADSKLWNFDNRIALVQALSLKNSMDSRDVSNVGYEDASQRVVRVVCESFTSQ